MNKEKTNHSPQRKSDSSVGKTENLRSGLVSPNPEDTSNSKGCGKWVKTPNSKIQSEHKCGEHNYLCPECKEK